MRVLLSCAAAGLVVLLPLLLARMERMLMIRPLMTKSWSVTMASRPMRSELRLARAAAALIWGGRGGQESGESRGMRRRGEGMGRGGERGG